MQLTEEVQQTVRTRFQQHDQNPDLPPMGRATTRAVLAALDGGREAAQAMLRETARLGEAAPAFSEAEVATLASAAIICDDFDLAGQVLSRSGDGAVRVEVGWRKVDGPPTRVGCRLVGPGEIAFRLPPSLRGARGFMTLVSRWLACVPLFMQASRRAGARRGRVRLHLNDGAQQEGLGFCTRSDAVTLIPDPDFLRSHGYALLREHLAANPVAWQDRKPVALWRGSPNGHRQTGQTWRSMQRVRLCEMVRGSALFDAGLTGNTLPHSDPGHAELPQSGLMRPPIEIHRFQEFRVQIDIDGFTNAWSGLFQKLLTGSPVMKVASEGGWRQWYYDRMVPWENYVPVSADLHDVVERAHWLATHEDEAAKIGAAGRKLAESLTCEAESAIAAETIVRLLR